MATDFERECVQNGSDEGSAFLFLFLFLPLYLGAGDKCGSLLPNREGTDGGAADSVTESAAAHECPRVNEITEWMSHR